MSDVASDEEIAELLKAQHGYVPEVRNDLECTEEAPRSLNAEDSPADSVKDSESSSNVEIIDSRFEPFGFDNIFELSHITHPNIDLYKWQVEEQMRLSGYLDPRGQKYVPTAEYPLRYAMVAANGAGKDSIIISPAAIFYILTQVRCRVVLTSASHQQLKGQTQGYLQTFVDDFNAKFGSRILDYIDLKIVCPQTDSEIIMFATDMAGKAEGWHPIEPGRWLVMILNEVKSINQDIIRATLRCSGYTHWIEVSSPGLIDTHFYRTVEGAECMYPNIPTPGQSFVRRITDEDCPHLSNAYKKALIEEFGDENHPIVLSALKAMFMSADTVYVIPSDFLRYTPLEGELLGGKLRAGLDLALGGDETVLSIWRGNRQIGQETWRIRHEPTLHLRLIEAFERYSLSPRNIWADAGGIGLPIIHRLAEAKWPVNSVRNDEKAFRRTYKNRGTELWWTLRRLIQDKVLHFMGDEKLQRQLKLRRYKISDDNRMILESKKDAKVRGEPSPDRADAAALAFAGIDMTEIAKLAIPNSDLKIGKYIVDFDGDPDEQIQNFIRNRPMVGYNTGSMMDKIARN